MEKYKMVTSSGPEIKVQIHNWLKKKDLFYPGLMNILIKIREDARYASRATELMGKLEELHKEKPSVEPLREGTPDIHRTGPSTGSYVNKKNELKKEITGLFEDYVRE